MVEDEHVEKVVERGFIRSIDNLTNQNELPPGEMISCIVDCKSPLLKVKQTILDSMKEQAVCPETWKYDITSMTQVHLLKLNYNHCEILDDNEITLTDYNVNLGALIYIEKAMDYPCDLFNAIPILSPRLNDEFSTEQVWF